MSWKHGASATAGTRRPGLAVPSAHRNPHATRTDWRTARLRDPPAMGFSDFYAYRQTREKSTPSL